MGDVARKAIISAKRKKLLDLDALTEVRSRGHPALPDGTAANAQWPR